MLPCVPALLCEPVLGELMLPCCSAPALEVLVPGVALEPGCDELPLGALSVCALLGLPPAADPACTPDCCEVLPAMLPAVLPWLWFSADWGEVPPVVELGLAPGAAEELTLSFSFTFLTPGTDFASSLASFLSDLEFTDPLSVTTPFFTSTFRLLRFGLEESFCLTCCSSAWSFTGSLVLLI